MERTKIKNGESSYRNIFFNAPEAIVIFDLESGTILEANNRALQLYGWSEDEFIGMDFTKLFSDIPGFHDHLDSLRKKGQALFSASFQTAKNGKTSAVNISSAIINWTDRRAVQSMIRIENPGSSSSDNHHSAVPKEQKPVGPLQRKHNIDNKLIRKISFVCSGFVMCSAMKSLISDQKVETDFIQYPEDYDPDDTSLIKSDFVIFAIPTLSHIEADDLKYICKKNKNLSILVVCMSVENSILISLIKAGIRGVITNEKEFNLLSLAVNAIAKGELWYPRSILQQVFDNFRISISGSRTSAASRIAGNLSEREMEILRLIVSGLKNKEIAEKLIISYSTVVSHVYNIYRKLGVTNRAEVIRYAINHRIVELH